jgi:tRNA (cytidine/uridine-2'-O-)-methyltransferase
MRIALFEPEIAGNVGAVLRTAACLGAAVDLIEPMGFPWSDKSLARAGMDYAGQVDVTRHADWEAYLATVAGRLLLFTTRASIPLPEVEFRAGDTLLFGNEGHGAPDFVHARADLRVRIPLRAGMRSLNLSVSAAIALAEGLRQTGGWPTGE